ncbi:MAG: hypothetical protein IIV04_03680 [Bacteroidaceae bacterium]|nr:hypothetical protein [Bacteroidaceae bacterium]
MKKLLLLFMSMFFMLGTSVAQDKEKEEENAAFALQYSTPADGEYVFTVYNIRLQFNKDIVVTIPEGGIAVTNKNTGDVVKITRLDNNEWIEKSTAVFLFEQESVFDEKEDKEELRDQVIETPGEWSYTIPAGCIKSVDGDEFAEQTFTFTIASSMDIESISPADAVTTLDKIEVTLPKAIASVNTGKLSLLDNSWMPASAFKSEVTYSDDRKTVTLELETPMTAPGTYSLNIYQGAFLSEDGALSNYREITLQVIDPTPSFATNLNDGDQVKELGNLEISFNNVSNVEIVKNDAIQVWTPSQSKVVGEASKDGNRIIVTFSQELKEEGLYTFYIPAGAFTMDGAPNEEREINVTLYSFVITPLEVVSVTPVEGAVEQIEKIVIEFNQPITLSFNENWQQISYNVTLKGDTKDYVLTYAPSGYGVSTKLEYLVNAEWNGFDAYVCSAPVAEAGTYTLNLKDVVVDYAGESVSDEWGTHYEWHAKNGCVDKSYTWTIADTAIDDVEAENGEKVIYDLTGRRVENITNAGIYIVNGKKVLVK